MDEEYSEEYSESYEKQFLDGFDSWNDQTKESINEDINLSNQIRVDFDEIIDGIEYEVVDWADESPYGKYQEDF